MPIFDAVFYLLCGLTISSAAIMVFSSNIIHNAIGLLFTFVGVSGIYAMLGADFLAATQLLIYVGGILVLLLFGVMLSQRVSGIAMRTDAIQLVPALLVSVGIIAILIRVLLSNNWNITSAAEMTPTVRTIGNLLMTKYLIPFEIVSVLLLAALVGAAFLGRRTAR